MEKKEEGKIGEIVEIGGNYVCENCGHYQYFDMGDEFEDCQSCYEPDVVWVLEQ